LGVRGGQVLWYFIFAKVIEANPPEN
jgi:hypothetical protein